MSSALGKALAVLEFMVEQPNGCQVSEIAAALEMPVSGVHRLLKELELLGYIIQRKGMGDYCLSIKLASLGLSFLGQTGISDISQPILDELAKKSGELVRLSLIDGDNLVWVGVAQGATSGLRYDPGSDQGKLAHLASSAGGQVWLSTMSDEAAIALVMKQGLVKETFPGDAAPQTVASLLTLLANVREQGFSSNEDSFLQGMAAIAMVVYSPLSKTPIGAVSIAGPSVRFGEQQMLTLVEDLRRAAAELGEASRASVYFSKRE